MSVEFDDSCEVQYKLPGQGFSLETPKIPVCFGVFLTAVPTLMTLVLRLANCQLNMFQLQVLMAALLLTS